MKSAAFHRAQARKIARNSTALTMYWWEVGDRLNQDYGYLDPDRYSKANDPARIPMADIVEMSKIYQIDGNTLRKIRRFSNLVRTPEEARAVAKEYRTWKNVVRGYVSGHSVVEIEARHKRDSRDHVEKKRADREIVNHVAQHAIITAPDNVRDELALAGYDVSELGRDIIEALGAKGMIDVAEQLDVIPRPKRIPRVRVRAS
jgi:hypothetical protein